VQYPIGQGYFLIDNINWEKTEVGHKTKAETYIKNLFVNLGLLVKVKEVKEVNCIPIDISQFCNMGFKDEKEGDERGGWTDQGSNDLRSLPIGGVKFKGISFSIIDPLKNKEKSCIILKSEHSKWGLKEAKGIKVQQKTPYVYFLHSSAWTKSGEEIAKYIINYTGGEKVEIPIIGGKNVDEWWKPVSDILEAEIGWSGPNPSVGEVGLWLFPWKNPKPEKEIESIDIVSNEKVSSILGLVAISVEK
jgi:beta-galactosidase